MSDFDIMSIVMQLFNTLQSILIIALLIYNYKSDKKYKELVKNACYNKKA